MRASPVFRRGQKGCAPLNKKIVLFVGKLLENSAMGENRKLNHRRAFYIRTDFAVLLERALLMANSVVETLPFRIATTGYPPPLRSNERFHPEPLSEREPTFSQRARGCHHLRATHHFFPGFFQFTLVESKPNSEETTTSP